MPLSPGTRLGTYEIVAPLGAGGMGEVYRAKDLRLGREIALKLLPAEMASHPERLARLEREARTVAGINHPNIVTLFSVEDDGDVRFLTMELVEGQSLDRLVSAGGLPLARLLEIAIPLADALVAAHEKGVVHRDLKPGNVMLTREGRVKVLDFGLAKPVSGEAGGPTGSAALTVEAPISAMGQIVGTVAYMAPEQLRGGTVDARSDLFALGVLLYELAAGRRPFSGQTFVDVSSSILRDAPEPLARIRADLPAGIERVIRACLEKDPARRPVSAREIRDDLRRLKHALDHGDHLVPATTTPERIASIAVLPFVNRSRDEGDEYFSDGLADELLDVLARIRGLRVAARASSFQFKGRNEDPAIIGAKLNVATLLDGSVRTAGDRIRVSVQLVKVADGYHLWSQTYDRTLDDIFAVQDDIAHAVVRELRTTLLGEQPDPDASGQAREEVALAARGRGTDPEAHRLYLLARHLLDRGTLEETKRGIEYLQQALARDPAFALAWTQLSGAYARKADWGWLPAAQGYALAREAVERALALEPDLAEGHKQLGWIRMYHDWDWRGAEASLARALELAPGNAMVLRGSGALAFKLGRLDDAIRLFRCALAQDPLNASAYHNLGWSLRAADELAEAEEALRESLELAPQRIVTRSQLAQTLLARGGGEAALAEAQREPDDAFRLWALAIIHHALGRRPESDAALQDLGDRFAEDAAVQIAEVHAARGESDAAFEWLSRAFEQRDPGLSDMKVSPYLRAVHDDARWAALMKRMGYEG